MNYKRKKYEKKYVRRIVGERKFVDTIIPGYGCDYRIPNTLGQMDPTGYQRIQADSTITDVSNVPLLHMTSGIYIHPIPVGTTAKMRIGNKVNLTSIQANLHFAPNVDDNYANFYQGPATNNVGRCNYVIRMMLVVDQDHNNQAAEGLNYNELFEASDSATPPAYGSKVFSPLKMDTAGRFKVLDDKFFHIDGDQGARVTLKYRKALNVPILYRTLGGAHSSGVQQECSKNCVYLLFYTDNPPTSQKYYPTMIGHIRVRYDDQ